MARWLRHLVNIGSVPGCVSMSQGVHPIIIVPVHQKSATLHLGTSGP